MIINITASLVSPTVYAVLFIAANTIAGLVDVDAGLELAVGRDTVDEVGVRCCTLSEPFTCPLLEIVGFGDSRFTTSLLVHPHTRMRLETSKIARPARNNHLIISIEF